MTLPVLGNAWTRDDDVGAGWPVDILDDELAVLCDDVRDVLAKGMDARDEGKNEGGPGAKLAVSP